MLKIGDFSRIAQVTIKTLRHYDRLGLLVPAEVDRFTGHRYYTVSQLQRLNRIRALKDVGMSLEQIGVLMDGDLSPEQMHGILRMKQAELRAEMMNMQNRLQQLESLMEHEGNMPNYDVVVKTLETQRVLSCRQNVDAEDIEYIFAEVGSALKRNGIKATGPWIALYHHEGFRSEDLDFEIAVPVAANVDQTIDLDSGMTLEPRGLDACETVATVIENGHNENWSGSYTRLGEWLETNAYDIVRPTREVYLTQPDSEEGWLIEIQFPVKKKEQKEATS